MRLIVITLVGLLSTLLASSASAQVIEACVHDLSGAVRIVSGPADCRTGESPLSWNTQGPPGPMGQPGPMGDPGPMGEPGQGQDIGNVVRIELPATSGIDTTWFVPTGKALLVDHIAWSADWVTSSDPLEVTLRHFINKVGSAVQTVLTSTDGFRSFERPLVLPANTGFDAPDLNDPLPFPREVYIYGRLVDADSALLSGAD